MSIKSVVKMGNKQLSSPSLPINDFENDALKTIIQDMRDTLTEQRGIGIAAPQIGHNIRMIMFEFEQSERYPNQNPVPLTILINPSYESVSDEMIDGWEGCLSVPGLCGLVPRYKKIIYRAFDPDGQPVTNTVEGLHARVIQHECDHLDGILYPQRIKDMRYFGFREELAEWLIPA